MLGSAARLHLVLAGLPHQEAVLLKVFADDAFVDGGHLDFGFRIPETGEVDLRGAESS